MQQVQFIIKIRVSRITANKLIRLNFVVRSKKLTQSYFVLNIKEKPFYEQSYIQVFFFVDFESFDDLKILAHWHEDE